MVDEVAVNSAISILKRMDEHKPECEHSSANYRIEVLGDVAIKIRHAVDKTAQVFRLCADVVGQRHVCVAVMLSDEPPFRAKS